MGSQSLSPGLGDEAETFPRSVAGREPALPICRDNACPGLDSRAPVWVRPQQEVGTFVLSLSPSFPAVPQGPVPRRRPRLCHLTPWLVLSIQLILSVLFPHL